MYLLLLLAIYPTISWSGLVQLIEDPLDNLDNWTPSPDGGVTVTDGTTFQIPIYFCTDQNSNCIQIQGFDGQDNYIERVITLNDIPNIDNYDSFAIQIDVHIWDLETEKDLDYCQVSIQYDGDADFTLLHQMGDREGGDEDQLNNDYDRFNEHYMNEIINFPIDHTKNTVTIRLETNGNAGGTGDGTAEDYCFWDNFFLYGRDEGECIWTDTMDNLNNWAYCGDVTSDDFSTDCDGQSCCTDGNTCVKLAGAFTGQEVSLSRATVNINEWKDLLIKYNVYLQEMEEDDSCQILYKYNNDEPDEYKLLKAVSGDDNIGSGGSHLHMNQIDEIPPPVSIDGLTTLFIKFQNNGDINILDDATSMDICYYDEIALKGVNEPAVALEINSDPCDHHIYVLGDFGGDDEPPWVRAEQLAMANMMKTITYLNDYDVEGIIALGDNFYNDGINASTAALRFEKTWRQVYHQSPIIKGIPWYPVAGNHDWRNGGDVQVQIDYSVNNLIPYWEYPNYYYTKTWDFGADITLQFIAFDSVIACGLSTGPCEPWPGIDANIAEEQWKWLEETVESSNATFILVGAHHPIYSYNRHGPHDQEFYNDRILNIMKKNPCAVSFISGHEHQVQFIEEADSTIQYIVSGGAHSCRHDLTHLDTNNPKENDPIKYNNCEQGGFVRCTVDISDITLQCFYYLGTDPNVKYQTGIWTNPEGNGCNDVTYTTVNELLAQPQQNVTIYPTICSAETVSPTNNPSLSPTAYPSLSPTRNPTGLTATPTKSPTFDDDNNDDSGGDNDDDSPSKEEQLSAKENILNNDNVNDSSSSYYRINFDFNNVDMVYILLFIIGFVLLNIFIYVCWSKNSKQNQIQI